MSQADSPVPPVSGPPFEGDDRPLRIHVNAALSGASTLAEWEAAFRQARVIRAPDSARVRLTKGMVHIEWLDTEEDNRG